MFRTLFPALFASLLFLSASALAVQPDEILKDPALEARARALSTGLRCLVCQNQSIDDSDAPLARDLRILLRERLSAGDSDEQVMSYLVDRYGEFVRLNPVFGWHTLLLWLGPFVLLIGAAAMLVVNRRKTVAVPEENTLSDADAKKFKELSSKAE